ncbi:MAG: hypothetical protein KGJ09_07340 [Candidatus Omnitrophica bacterium]|nr:hypothetical protein [Candidatus Omnitrophota bacterium]MDE2009876.1 hypothetical protein [Candidatus Omnitrophota bacterium]MDE2214342.1 hypothetical protein [Candidatus Omnitrophota bacterium]MDE2231091.1 hypothetical protein [Candidatus Omnitrophota bacterium]
MANKYILFIGLLSVLSSGCTLRDAGYTLGGAAAGGGIGYAIHHDAKDAVIGGLGGALVGNLAAQWQDKIDKNKKDKSYKDGYNQARLDIAKQNWNDNTGKDADGPQPLERTVLVPKDKENGVIYDQRAVAVEEDE